MTLLLLIWQWRQEGTIIPIFSHLLLKHLYTYINIYVYIYIYIYVYIYNEKTFTKYCYISTLYESSTD